MILQSRLSTAPQPTSSTWMTLSSNFGSIPRTLWWWVGPKWLSIASPWLNASSLSPLVSATANLTDACSTAWLSLWKALLLFLRVAPTAVISLHLYWEQKPLTPTSTGNSQVRQPFSLQRSRSSVYVAFFLS